MRTLHLSLSDTYDGAGRAAYRLHQGLRAIGVDSQMLVQYPHLADPTVYGPAGPERLLRYARPYLDRLPLAAYPGRQIYAGWSVGWLPSAIHNRATSLRPDVIHLHWVGGGYLPIRSVAALGRPVVWTLHDMGALTGGCHYDGGCGRYTEGCGRCPQLGSHRESDLSRRTLRRKADAWADVPITIVAPSRWMAARARESALFAEAHIEVIPNGIDTTAFQPQPRAAARAALGLPADRDLLLFGANNSMGDQRKGAAQLHAAIGLLAAAGRLPSAMALIFGASDAGGAPPLGIPARYLGYLRDDAQLAALYAVADIFVAPSLQDNLPNTVMEAMSCGTPVAAFAVGGVPDMVEHRCGGYLATPGDAADLAEGIAWLLSDTASRAARSGEARAKVCAAFDLRQVADRHAQLYQELAPPEP